MSKKKHLRISKIDVEDDNTFVDHRNFKYPLDKEKIENKEDKEKK